jgi:hypothetical protein
VEIILLKNAMFYMSPGTNFHPETNNLTTILHVSNGSDALFRGEILESTSCDHPREIDKHIP